MENLNLVKAVKNNRQLAFHYRDYNWFIAGSFLSRTGDWFDRVALNWFVFTLTNSPLSVGIVEFCRLIPILFFSILGGIAADKWERRRVLIVIQTGAMAITFILGVSMLYGTTLPLLVLLILLRGVFLAFEIPARNAFIPDLVPRDSMVSAISFFSATLNIARIIGPAIAGLLLSVWSPAVLILINAFSFIAVIGMLILIKTHQKRKVEGTTKQSEKGIKEAIGYLKEHPLILSVCILGLIPMIFGYPYTTLIPVFAEELLGVGPEGFGLLLSFAAIGSVVSSMMLGWGKNPFMKGKLFFGCICSFGVGLILFSVSHIYWLSLLLMFVIGVVSQGYSVTQRVIIQEIIPNRIRGRILSIVMMDSGFVPLGSLLVGFLGETRGPVFALFFMGCLCIVAACVTVAMNRQIVNIR